jgi:hypothetical protein
MGGTESIPLDVRVISSTNRDVQQLIEEKKFREDLYYRLNVFPIVIPSLRERPGDIVPLARHFLAGCAKAQGRALKLGESAAAILAGHDWPGNVRELENTMQRAAILAPGDAVEAEHIVLGSQRVAPRPLSEPAPTVAAAASLPAANDAEDCTRIARSTSLPWAACEVLTLPYAMCPYPLGSVCSRPLRSILRCPSRVKPLISQTSPLVTRARPSSRRPLRVTRMRSPAANEIFSCAKTWKRSASPMGSSISTPRGVRAITASDPSPGRGRVPRISHRSPATTPFAP